MNADRMDHEHHRIAAATDELVRSRRPLHLWVIGIIALLWNLPSALEHLALTTRNSAYLSNYTPAQIAYYDSFPLWVDISWGVAVWTGLIGAILLLARSRHAVHAFGLSIIAMVATTVWQFVLAETGPVDMMGNAAIVMIILIWIVALGLFLYALDMRRRKILR